MNLKYYAEWNDFENNRHRLEWRVPSVVVSPEQLTVRDCVLQYPSINVFSKDCLIGCGIEITIVSPERFDFLSEFYKADVKGMAVKHYIRYGQDGQYLNFHGYLDTEVYQDDFGSLKNYDIRLTANNGLALLSRFSFLDEDGNVYKGMLRNLDIIKRCLSILDIDYDYIYINHVPTMSVIGPEETIYHKVYSKSENFYDELGEPMTMKEVLEGLIFAHGAKLFIYNNSVYIIDTLYLPQTSIPCKRYEFDTLDYVDTVIIDNDAEALDEIQGTPSLAVTSAKNKIKIQFNKYVYSSEENIGVTPENVSNIIQTLDHYKNDEFLFRETHYQNCSSIDTFPTSYFPDDFIVRTGREGDTQESFVRIYPSEYASEYRIRFKSKRFIQADVLYIVLSGQIRVVDIEHFGETNAIPGSDLWTVTVGTVNVGKTFPLFIRPVLLDGEGNVIAQYTIPDKLLAVQFDELYTSTGYWTAGISAMPIEFCMYPANTGHHIEQYNYNTWYDLNGSVLVPSFTAKYRGMLGGRDNVFAIPLYNPKDNKEFAPQGGYLAFDIYFPNKYVSPKSSIDLKDISISVVDTEYRKKPIYYSFFDRWGIKPGQAGVVAVENYKKVEDKDIINEIVGDVLFSTDSSFEVTQGTDDLGLARGTYSVFVSGKYGDTDATNERFENLEKVQYIAPNVSSFTYPFNTDSEVNGIIRTMVQLPDDGGILIGGDLTTYKGVSKPFSFQANVFKLNADGSVDSTFPFLQTYTGSGGVRRMKIYSGVLYVALQRELAAYSLTTWARLRSVTVATDAILDFEIVGSYIYIVGSFKQARTQADGGGSFTSASGIAKYAISDFERQAFGTGNGAGVDTNGYINTIAYRSYGGSAPRLWVGGRFDTVYTNYGTGGVARKNIAMFTLEGEVVNATFSEPIEFNKQSGNAEVFHIYVTNFDWGRVLIAGNFDSVKFPERPAVASNGVISFIPDNDYIAMTYTLSASNLIFRRVIRIADTHNFYIVGKTSGGVTAQSIIRKVDYTLRPDREFFPQQPFPVDADIHDLIVREDDLIVGGDFDSYMEFSFNNIVALQLNGFPKGISGGFVSLQEYVLNVFFAQLKQPRYTLTGMKVKGYYSPFQLFVYELVKRGEIVCKFIPKKMTFDLVMGTTDMDLEELI